MPDETKTTKAAAAEKTAELPMRAERPRATTKAAAAPEDPAMQRGKDGVEPYVKADGVAVGETYVVRQGRVVHYPVGVSGPFTGARAAWLRAGEAFRVTHPFEVECLRDQHTKLRRVASVPEGAPDATRRAHPRQFQILARKFAGGAGEETSAERVAAEAGGVQAAKPTPPDPAPEKGGG